MLAPVVITYEVDPPSWGGVRAAHAAKARASVPSVARIRGCPRRPPLASGWRAACGTPTEGVPSLWRLTSWVLMLLGPSSERGMVGCRFEVGEVQRSGERRDTRCPEP